MPYPTNYPAPMQPAGGVPGLPPRPGKRSSGRKQVILNILSICVALCAAYEVFAVSDFFAYDGMTNDDATIAAENSVWKLFFDPLGFALLLGLLIAAFAIHRASKSMRESSNAVTLTGLILTGLAFVLSLLRVSIAFPLLFGGLGQASNELQNGSDVRAPVAGEFVLEPAQLVQYNDASGVRVATTLANSSPVPWQAATVAITYADAAGTPCGTLEQVEEYIAPGQQRAITTEFLAAAIYYNDPSCVPVTAAAALTSIDVDSRSDIPPADYEHAVTVFDALAPLEDPWIDGSTVKLSVAGIVAPGSMVTLLNGTVLPVGFEVIDRQGLRLSWCATADEVSPEGNFTTGTFHSPVAPGEFHTVVALPGGC